MRSLISSALTIIIMAISFSLAIIAYAYFHEYVPQKTETEYAKNLTDKLQTEADKLPSTKKRVQKAIQMVNESSTTWAEVVKTHTPPTSVAAGGIDLSKDPYTLVSDTVAFRNNIQRAVNAQITKGGVKLLEAGPYVPGPTDFDNTGGLLSSFYNYPDFKFPILIFNFGTIRVQGTYDQIIANVESYKTMPHYLAVTDGLRIDGTSPNLVGTYQLSVIGFIRTTKLPGTVPEASATPAGFGGGAPGGRGRQGIPGMGPPGGPGGLGTGGPPTGIPGAPGGRGDRE